MRTMYVTRTKVMSSVTVKVIDEEDYITTETYELPLRQPTEARAEREINKRKMTGGKKIIKVVSIKPVIKRYRMEESQFLSLAEEIEPLTRDIKKHFGEDESEETEDETENEYEYESEEE